MAALLAEGIVDKLMTYYKANLPAKVTTLNAAYSDSFKMTAPQTGAYHAGPLQLVDNIDYPKVFVLARNTGVSRYNATFTDADHRLDVIVAIKADTGERVQRLMYRYGRAMWELTVSRFFASTGDDYFALHGDGDIEIEFEEIDAQITTPPYIGKVTLSFTASKQEDV